MSSPCDTSSEESQAAHRLITKSRLLEYGFSELHGFGGVGYLPNAWNEFHSIIQQEIPG